MAQHKLIDAVTSHFGIDPSLHTRQRDVVDARMAIMVALRTLHSQQEIARMFRFNYRKDGEVLTKAMSHCTVLHAEKQHKIKYHEDPAKRMAHFRHYCDIFDFCASYLSEHHYVPITQEEMRQKIQESEDKHADVVTKMEFYKEAFETEKKAHKETAHTLGKELRQTKAELEQIKRAFKALYNEKKARDEESKKQALKDYAKV